MKVLLFVLLMLCFVPSSPAQTTKTSTLADEEKVLSEALAIRAKVVEKVCGIRFTFMPQARLERFSVQGINAVGMYDTESTDCLFQIDLWYKINVEFKSSLSKLNPDDVADYEYFQKIADHELGHALLDQVSRRSGNGPFFTKERFYSSSNDEALGLDVITEGVATWVEDKTHNSQTKASELYFPENSSQEFYTYETIAFNGGFWLVDDILNTYGEKGLIWIASHPLVLRTNKSIRADAISYRNQALLALLSEKPILHR